MEETNKGIPEIDLEGLEGKDLEEACARLFSNLGWNVNEGQIISYETGTISPDIVLSDGSKVCGFVEVISSMKPEAIRRKKEEIQVIIDKCKPAIFILTNGKVFDIFYDGKYSGSNSTPPSAHTFGTIRRLNAYSNILTKAIRKGE